MPSRKPTRPRPATSLPSAGAPTQADTSQAAPAVEPPPAQAAPAQPPPPSAAPAAPLPASHHEPLLERGQPMVEPLTAYELAPEALLAPDGGLDRAFVPDLAPSVREFGSTRSSVRVCEWCNAPLSDDQVATCPGCGANLKPVEPDADIPGLTTMTLEAVLARRRAEAQQQATSNAAGRIWRSVAPAPPAITPRSLELDDATIEGAIKPPDDAVRRAMLQLEIEALRAQAPAVAAEPPVAGAEAAAGDAPTDAPPAP